MFNYFFIRSSQLFFSQQEMHARVSALQMENEVLRSDTAASLQQILDTIEKQQQKPTKPQKQPRK
jgi:uncharacterized membrane protein YccC